MILLVLGGKSHVNSGFGAAIITDQSRTTTKLNKIELDEMEMERFATKSKIKPKRDA